MSNLDSTTPPAAAATEMGAAERDSTTSSVSALNGTPKCKKKKKNKTREQQELPPVLYSAAAAEAEGLVEAKGDEVEEQEATDAAASAMEGTPKCDEEDAKAKVSLMPEKEANTTVVSDSESTPKHKKRRKQKNKIQGQLDSAKASHSVVTVDITVADKSENGCTDVIGASGHAEKKKIKKKKNKTREQQELPPVLYSAGTGEAEGVEAKGNGAEEQEATDVAASAMEETPKRDEEDAKAKVSSMTEKEANTTVVSVSESTPKHKKRRKKKNKIEGQLDSAKASHSVVTVDITMADKSESGCADVVGASGHADVNMDPINGDDPSSDQSKANDADALLKNKDGNKGNKNCAENGGLLQESSAGKKRRRGKRKRASANGGPSFSSDNGGAVTKHSLHSSANHGLSCICASCLVVAHEDKIRNIYSPRGSLVRFQRKKLLILDLNGLLADINQDYHNAHLAHAKVRTKLVFRRPYCDDFLRFCFQNFELGIWSSRKRENVKSVVDILMRDLKQYLLFCWDMSYCTVTGCKTIDNKNKPLVLKELKKVWNKDEPNLPWEQGEFSPSNTLLVDDSPYKALCNPPNTAIFPEPYSYLNQRDDYSLGPGGNLRVYLQRIAAADDVQNFVRDNPFGQKSITETDPNWNFYVKIVDKMEKQIVDKVENEVLDKVEKEVIDKSGKGNS